MVDFILVSKTNKKVKEYFHAKNHEKDKSLKVNIDI